MSLLKKLFSKKPPEKVAPLPADSPAFQGEPLKAFDKFGREINVARKDWFESVLKGNIENAWDDAEQLANLITSAFNDGFLLAMEGPTARLQAIDPNKERGTTYHAIFYQQSKQPERAQNILETHIRQHGASGIILTNLAKAQSALGREDESLQTLWSGLELDPNQDNGLLWYESIHREKGGEAGGQEALRRIATLPGSWRAQLWLARAALQSGQLEEAITLYQQSLGTASSPPPTDLLQQMSGDLGKAGYLGEIIAHVSPHFDAATHGLIVGNNLIKANIDTGQLDAAKRIIQQLQLQHRHDWQQSLGYWENELAKAACATNTPRDELPSVSLLWMEGPITCKSDAPTAALFPEKDPEAPRICFIGSTAETTGMGGGVVQQPSDNPGRFSRSLPLLMADHVYNQTSAHSCTLTPWVGGEQSSFVLSGVMWKDDDAASHARNGETPNDYVVISHLKARGESWTLCLRLVRTIDAKCLQSFEYPFAECAPDTICSKLFQDLDQFLHEEAGAELRENARLAPPSGNELNHHVFQLGQALAVRCYAMDNSNALGLSNPSEIINSQIRSCVETQKNINCRLLLLRTLTALKKVDRELTAAFKEKAEALMREHALNETASHAIQEELNEVFSV